jgi:hypothetical protein
MTKHTEYRRLYTDPLFDFVLKFEDDGVFLDDIIIENGVQVYDHPDQSGVFTSEVMHQAYEIETDKFALVFERYYKTDGEYWEAISENFWIAGCGKSAKKYLKQLLETIE